MTTDHLTAALKTATTDEKQVQKAKALGEEIRAEKGVERAIESIYRDLVRSRRVAHRSFLLLRSLGLLLLSS